MSNVAKVIALLFHISRVRIKYQITVHVYFSFECAYICIDFLSSINIYIFMYFKIMLSLQFMLFALMFDKKFSRIHTTRIHLVYFDMNVSECI